jgi:hypothetical protein
MVLFYLEAGSFAFVETVHVNAWVTTVIELEVFSFGCWVPVMDEAQSWTYPVVPSTYELPIFVRHLIG